MFILVYRLILNFEAYPHTMQPVFWDNSKIASPGHDPAPFLHYTCESALRAEHNLLSLSALGPISVKLKLIGHAAQAGHATRGNQ